MGDLLSFFFLFSFLVFKSIIYKMLMIRPSPPEALALLEVEQKQAARAWLMVEGQKRAHQKGHQHPRKRCPSWRQRTRFLFRRRNANVLELMIALQVNKPNRI